MKKNTVTPMLVATLAHLATNYTASWSSAKNEVQKVVDLYKKTGLPALTNDELHRLFNDTENLVHDKLTGNKEMHLQAGNDTSADRLPINRSKAMELLTKPTGYNELLAGVTACNKICAAGFSANNAWQVRFNSPDINKMFVIDDSGTLQYSDAVQKDIDGSGKVYATTERGQAIYAFLQKVGDAFKEFGIAQHIYPGVVADIDGSRIAELVEEGIASINVETGKIRPVLRNTNTTHPDLPFDRDRG
jgi:hypothetical protein